MIAALCAGDIEGFRALVTGKQIFWRMFCGRGWSGRRAAISRSMSGVLRG
jgi:hypothetical protein